MKFNEDSIAKLTTRVTNAAIEFGKTAFGVAATAVGVGAVMGVVGAVAFVAEWSIIAEIVVFIVAALGLPLAVMSLAEAFAGEDYSSKARLQGCALAGAACTGFMIMITAAMFGAAAAASALALFAVFMLSTQFQYLEPMPLNRVLPVALGGDCPDEVAYH